MISHIVCTIVHKFFLKGVLFCDIYGNICFENSMQNVTLESNCDCPMECNSISYSFAVLLSSKFESREMCHTETKTGHFLMKEYYAHKFPPQIVRKMIEIRSNVSSDAVEYCKRNLPYRAEIIFRMATDSISVRVMSSRLSFFDKMSAFGIYPQ